jgi:hypothetical protein
MMLQNFTQLRHAGVEWFLYASPCDNLRTWMGKIANTKHTMRKQKGLFSNKQK